MVISQFEIDNINKPRLYTERERDAHTSANFEPVRVLFAVFPGHDGRRPRVRSSG